MWTVTYRLLEDDDVAEDYCRLGCDAIKSGGYVATFRRNTVSKVLKS
jgi:hypothetical protein